VVGVSLPIVDEAEDEDEDSEENNSFELVGSDEEDDGEDNAAPVCWIASSFDFSRVRAKHNT
jgi:hypothetical protein